MQKNGKQQNSPLLFGISGLQRSLLVRLRVFAAEIINPPAVIQPQAKLMDGKRGCNQIDHQFSAEQIKENVANGEQNFPPMALRHDSIQQSYGRKKHTNIKNGTVTHGLTSPVCQSIFHPR